MSESPLSTPSATDHGEDELKVRLVEREMLLREVHHRVKNDMATITSYLSVQADGLSYQSRERLVLLEARSRVESMMHLYDRLSRSEDFRTIPAGSYLHDLIDELRCLIPDPNRIFIEADCEVFPLDSSVLFPLGMAVNELVTNAIKHAFPDGRRGTVRVTLRRDPKGAALAKVEDDGVGLPKSGRFEPGFGSSLVPALAAQIGGTLEKISVLGKGTAFQIRIP